ncbi:hypothetical protein RJ639_030529 [Escallonia herrerae]|uniref:RING-type E3 ubiquitin transferase n=1 Tax=Escallonia herrerae TaxID=1293975 RepID=A0AA89BCE5_9ASTE|nr:hypothetical protein RJ639_030529 [Escallonia herrerae]
MPSTTGEHVKLWKPRNNSGSNELTKKPKKKDIFMSVIFGGLGCGGASSTALAPAVIQPEPKKMRVNKKKKQKKRVLHGTKRPANLVLDIPVVCCAPPWIGFASDVAPRGRVDTERTNRREHSHAARQIAIHEHVSDLDSQAVFSATHLRSDVSDARQYRRFRRRSPGGDSEMLLQHNLLFGESLGASDRFGNWRLNLDSMSYEELLGLSDRIGYVGTGLREDEILLCVRKTKLLTSPSTPMLSDIDWKCCICQEGREEDDELGRLDCGHYHHIYCIQQWLRHKNACPVCNTAAVAHM